MHVFVINLARDVNRRNSIREQLEKLELEFEFVSGVDGSNLTEEERSTLYDDRGAKLHRSRSLVPAEIGCALSHLDVYQSIIDRDIDCALVLEDDVILPPTLERFLNASEKHLEVESPVVWLLSPAEGELTSPPLRITETSQLFPFRSGYYASSYIVTRAAAYALYDELKPVSDVADCWRRLFLHKVVDIYVVHPALIEQNQRVFGSSTTEDYRAHVREHPLARAVYLTRRIRSTIWLKFYTLFPKKDRGSYRR